MDYTVHGILQARILEWVAYPFSRESSRPRNRTGVFCIASGFFTNWAIRGALWSLYWVCFCFMFWVFGGQAFRILAPGPGIKPALEGEILPTGVPSHSWSLFLVSIHLLILHSAPWLEIPTVLYLNRSLISLLYGNSLDPFAIVLNKVFFTILASVKGDLFFIRVEYIAWSRMVHQWQHQGSHPGSEASSPATLSHGTCLSSRASKIGCCSHTLYSGLELGDTVAWVKHCFSPWKCRQTSDSHSRSPSLPTDAISHLFRIKLA